MTASNIRLPPDSTGKKLRTWDILVGSDQVHEQAVVICDDSGNIIGVLNSAPAGTEYGIVTRNIPSGTQAVSGPVTDAQLRASSVPVSGPLTDTQLRATPVPTSGTVTANLGTIGAASTAAKQDTGNTSLASLDTKLPSQGQALAAASLPVVLTAAQVTTLTPPSQIVGFATSAKQDTLQTAIDAINTKFPAQGQALAAASLPVVLTAAQLSTLTPPAAITGYATSAKQDTGNTSVASIDTKTPALGQALAAASVPVILPAATITTLTPPAAITGFATSAKQDTLQTAVDAINTKTPALGQALAAASVPVILPSATVTTLTPPAAITGFATETGGNLAAAAASLNVMDDWDETDRAKVNIIAGQAGVDGNSGNKSAATQRVVLATDQPALTTPMPTAEAGNTVGTWTDATDVSVPSASTATILASNASRKACIFQNTGANSARIGGGSVGASRGYLLRPGASVAFEAPFCVTAAFTAYGNGATTIAPIEIT